MALGPNPIDQSRQPLGLAHRALGVYQFAGWQPEQCPHSWSRSEGFQKFGSESSSTSSIGVRARRTHSHQRYGAALRQRDAREEGIGRRPILGGDIPIVPVAESRGPMGGR